MSFGKGTLAKGAATRYCRKPSHMTVSNESGAAGVSVGSGEQDHAVAEAGAAAF